ncbi:LysM peptidoglycan-binding domain-containing protein [Dyella tabacisoli]|uniref:LysM domain-containing protein n=1 Tax=Dyella tabacisoli TaxID=2282381 RepID=A0A369UQ79_9GAMM|nr:hypothetical protein [Dyella tabacisoli]RDD81888.1 hypothetical protein DVJ77_08815 [Dyella tabacisoli]
MSRQNVFAMTRPTATVAVPAKRASFGHGVFAGRLPLLLSLIACLGTACSKSTDSASDSLPAASAGQPVTVSQVWTPSGLCADSDRIEISDHSVMVMTKGQRHEFGKLDRSKPDLIQVTDNHRDDRLAFVLASGRGDSDGVLYFNAGTGNGGAEVRDLVGTQFNRCDSTPINPQQAQSAPPQPDGVVLHQDEVYASDGLKLELRPGIWRLDDARLSKLSILDKGERFEFSIVDEKGVPTVVVIDASRAFVLFKSATDVLDGKVIEDHYYVFDRATKSLVDLAAVMNNGSRPLVKLDYEGGNYHFNVSGTTRDPAEKTDAPFTEDIQFAFNRRGDLKIISSSDEDASPEKIAPLSKAAPKERVVQLSPCDRGSAPATYVTVEKDTLFKVAKAQGVDINMLSRINPSAGLALPVGTVLDLPVRGAGAPMSELRVQLNDIGFRHQSFAALKVHAGACSREVTTDANGMTPTLLLGGVNESVSYEYLQPDGSYIKAEGADNKAVPVGHWSVDLSSRVMQLQPLAGDEPFSTGEASPFPFCPGCTFPGLSKDPALVGGQAGQKFVLPRFNETLGKDAKAWIYRRTDGGLLWSGAVLDPHMTELMNKATTDQYKIFVGFDGWSTAFDEIKDDSDATAGEQNDAAAE